MMLQIYFNFYSIQNKVYTKNKVTYMPVYFVMCIERTEFPEGDYIF